MSEIHTFLYKRSKLKLHIIGIIIWMMFKFFFFWHDELKSYVWENIKSILGKINFLFELNKSVRKKNKIL